MGVSRHSQGPGPKRRCRLHRGKTAKMGLQKEQSSQPNAAAITSVHPAGHSISRGPLCSRTIPSVTGFKASDWLFGFLAGCDAGLKLKFSGCFS